MAYSWEKFDPDVAKAAMKILGPQAKIPDVIPAIEKVWDRSHDTWTEFKAARKRLKDALDDFEQMEKDFQAAWQAQEDAIDKENFGLADPKKDKDKIAAARKPFLKRVDEILQDARKESDNMKKVDAAVKIIMDVQR
jgi:hypothetical protein